MTLDPITTAIIGFLFGMTVGHFWTKEDNEDGRNGCAFKQGER